MKKLKSKLFQKFENQEIDSLDEISGGAVSGQATQTHHDTYITLNTDYLITHDDGDGNTYSSGRIVDRSSGSAAVNP